MYGFDRNEEFLQLSAIDPLIAIDEAIDQQLLVTFNCNGVFMSFIHNHSTIVSPKNKIHC